MKLHRKILSIFFLFGFCIAFMKGQQTIPATGGNASGSGGSVSYTVGQILNSTISGTNGTVAQGVQQPYEISIVTATEEAKDIILEIQVYPNPATDFMKLKISNYNIQNLRYQLYDVNGSLLQDNKIEDNETSFVISNYVSAIYFLKVTDNNKVIKTFKIIKH
jgi:hypothetical protein